MTIFLLVYLVGCLITFITYIILCLYDSLVFRTSDLLGAFLSGIFSWLGFIFLIFELLECFLPTNTIIFDLRRQRNDRQG